MSYYKGYAQQRGFDPVKIPDPSGQILKQGQDQMRGMEKVLAANKLAAAQTVSDLKERAAKELENADLRFQAKSSVRDVLAKQKWKQFEGEIRNEQIKQKNRERSEQFKADLLKMVPKGLKMLQQANEAKREKIDQFALDIYHQYGIGARKFEQIRTIDDHTFNFSMRQEGYVADLDLQGIPYEVMQQIRRAGGYAQLRVAELSAMRLGRRMENVYFDNWNTKFDIAGQEVDLASAEGPVIEEVLRRISRKEREELGKNWPSVNVWVSSGAYEVDQKAQAAVRKKKATDAEAKALDEQHNDEIETINHQIGRNNGKGRWSGPIGVVSSIYYYAGGEDAPGYKLAESRRRVTAAVVHALGNNELDWDDVKGLEILPVKQRGTNKEQAWGDLFKKEWAQIEAAGLAAADRKNASSQIGSKLREAADNDMHSELEELVLNEDVSVQSLTKFARVADNKGFKKTHGWIVKQIATSQNAANDAIGMAELQVRFNNFEIVTNDEIDSMNMSLEARRDAKLKARDHNILLPQPGKDGTAERLKNRIKKELYDIIPKSEIWSEVASHKDAALDAFEKASSFYSTARSQKNMSHRDAYKYALDAVTTIIRDPEGDYSRSEIDSNGHRTHKGFAVTKLSKDDYIRDDSEQLKNTLGRDHTLIHKEPIHSKVDITNTLSQLNKGIRANIGPRSTYIDSLTGVSHIDQLLGQREYWANKEIAEKGSTTIPEVPEWFIKESRKIEGYVGPETRRMLNYYSEGKVNQALLTSGSGVAYTKPLMTKAHPIGQAKSGGNYDALDEGTGKGTLGFLLTGSTVREVLEVLEREDVSKVGAYQLTFDQIQEAVESGAISYETLFDTDTQDNLFEYVVKTGNWYTGDDTDEPPDEQTVFFFESLTEMLNSDSMNSKWGFHNPAFINPEAFDFLYNKELRYVGG